MSQILFPGLQSIFMTEYLFSSDQNISQKSLTAHNFKTITDKRHIYENNITAIIGANFDRKYCSVVTESEENQFLKGYLHFLSRDPCVNSGKFVSTVDLLNT